MDQLIQYSLQVGVGFVTDNHVAVQVHKQLHAFAFGQTRLTDDRQKKQISSKTFELLLMNVDV